VTARAHVVVRGRVQGVSFRWYARERANSLGLSGWIRNLHDGTVEAVFEGPRELVDSMVGWCGHGPRGAEVAGVDVGWEEPTGEAGFDVR
jgi:acylphosphatase